MKFAKIILLILTLCIGVFQAQDKFKVKPKRVKNNDFDYMTMSSETYLKVCTYIHTYYIPCTLDTFFDKFTNF